MPTSKLPDALVADANVLLSATIGGRASRVLENPAAPKVYAPTGVGDEILEHLPAIARKRRLDLGILLPVVAALPVQWIDADDYAPHEKVARRRIGDRDAEDWHVVAAVLYLRAKAIDLAIWTQDRDFSVTGIQNLTTGDLLDHLEGRAR